MPIYEYQCLGCAHEFETIQKFSDPELKRCPQCGKDLLKKKISAVAFRLKGGGWYETDFKSGDKRNVAGADESSKSSDGETKPAAAEAGAPAKSGDSGASAASKEKAPAKEASGSSKPVEKPPKPSAAKSESKND